MQLLPQLKMLVLSEHAAPQRCVPELQVKSHATPLQVALPLNGGEQGVHEVAPHELTERFETQAPLQPCAPVLQVKPHETPSHVATEFDGGVHDEHAWPHELIAVLLTQALPQR